MAIMDRIFKRLGYTKVEKKSYVQTITYSDPYLIYKKPESTTDFIDVYKTHPLVRAIVDKVAKAVAGIPFELYKKNERGEYEKVNEHPLIDLFYAVNDYMTSFDFWEQLTISLEVTGNFLCEIEMDVTGKPIALHPMRTDLVDIIPDPEKRVRAYKYTANGRSIIIPAENVMHIYYYDPSNPLWGLSPLSSLALTLVTDFYARAYNRRFFENDASVPAVLETDDYLDPEQVELISRMWKASHQGVDKAHSIAVLYGGLKYKETGTRPKDTEFLSLIKLDREEICAVLGVPPAVVGLFEYSNYANSEAQISMFWQDKIIPLLRKIEQMITEQFIQKFYPDVVGKFDMTKISSLLENEIQNAQVDEILIRNGLATVNERRALRGLGPVPWGDTWYVSMTLAPVGNEVEKKQDIGQTILKLKENAIEKLSSRYTPKLAKFFEQQAERVRRKLERVTGQRIQKDFEALDDEEDERLENVLKGIWLAAMLAAIEHLRKTVPELPTVDLDRIYPLLAQRVKGINDTTREKIADVIKKGIEQGKDFETIWQGSEEFKGIKQVFEEASDYRAKIIARTEISNAYNTALITTYREGGIKKVRVIDGQLPTSCEPCIERNGLIVTIEEASVMEEHPNGTLAFDPIFEEGEKE